MKTQTKLPTLTLFLGTIIFSAGALASTDWHKLVELAPQVKSARVNTTGPSVLNLELKMYPNGAIRAVYYGIGNVSPMKLIVANPDKVSWLNLCNAWQKNPGRSSFRASLVFNKDPLSGVGDIILSNGSKLSYSQIQNPLVFENEVVIKTPGSFVRWGAWDSQYNDVINDYVAVIQKAISESQSSEVTIDLSTHNGLACDMMAKNFKVQLSKRASYEVAMPDRFQLLGQSQYVDLYSNFYRQKQVLNLKSSEAKVQRELDLIVFGSSSLKNFDESIIKGNPRRVIKLFNSLLLDNGLTEMEKQEADEKQIDSNMAAIYEYSNPQKKILKNTFDFDFSPDAPTFLTNEEGK